MRICYAVVLLTSLALGGCAGTMPAMDYPAEITYPAAPARSSPAAKVAEVLAANDITLPMVAAYLHERGLAVHPSALPRWRWSAPTTGAPVAYYTWRMVGAVGDTSLVHYLPQAVGTYRLEVRGVSGSGAVGPWSLVGWSGAQEAAGALPGVAD